MTEELRRERLMIRCEKDRAKKTKKNYKRKKKKSSVTEDNNEKSAPGHSQKIKAR